MLETTKKFVEEVNELKDICMKEIVTSDMFENMNTKEFIAFKKMFKLMDTSMELLVKQAEHMEAQDKKLDEVLDLLYDEKRS